MLVYQRVTAGPSYNPILHQLHRSQATRRCLRHRCLGIRRAAVGTLRWLGSPQAHRRCGDFTLWSVVNIPLFGVATILLVAGFRSHPQYHLKNSTAVYICLYGDLMMFSKKNNHYKIGLNAVISLNILCFTFLSSLSISYMAQKISP